MGALRDSPVFFFPSKPCLSTTVAESGLEHQPLFFTTQKSVDCFQSALRNVERKVFFSFLGFPSVRNTGRGSGEDREPLAAAACLPSMFFWDLHRSGASQILGPTKVRGQSLNRIELLRYISGFLKPTTPSNTTDSNQTSPPLVFYRFLKTSLSRATVSRLYLEVDVLLAPVEIRVRYDLV